MRSLLVIPVVGLVFSGMGLMVHSSPTGSPAAQPSVVTPANFPVSSGKKIPLPQNLGVNFWDEILKVFDHINNAIHRLEEAFLGQKVPSPTQLAKSTETETHKPYCLLDPWSKMKADAERLKSSTHDDIDLKALIRELLVDMQCENVNTIRELIAMHSSDSSVILLLEWVEREVKMWHRLHKPEELYYSSTEIRHLITVGKFSQAKTASK